MVGVLKNICFLLLMMWVLPSSAKIYGIGRLGDGEIIKIVEDTAFQKNFYTEEIDTVLFSNEAGISSYDARKKNRMLTSIMGYFSLFLVLGFFINIIPFSRWIKRQKPTMELSLYQVRGKFTYFNVLAWIEVMEHSLGYVFKVERRKLSLFNERAIKRNKPFSIYTTKVNEYLYMRSFGDSPRSIALKRMKGYAKVVYAWNLLLFFTPINYAVWYWRAETGSYGTALFIGFFAGLIPGWILWGVGRWIINFILLEVGNSWIRSKGDAGYLHELMHQFTGAHNSYWAPLEWSDTSKTEISGLDGTDYTMGNINFKDSSKGGSKGSW